MSEIEHVNVHEAKTHLSKLLERVEAGEEFVIDRAGKPIAMLTRLPQPSRPLRVPGRWKGLIDMEHFDDPLPEDIAAAFRGERP